MDRCHYCGYEYHPMPVYTKPGSRINVCHIRIEVDEHSVEIVEHKECRDKAEADGYTFRSELTPRR